jgi:hypothetical protein
MRISREKAAEIIEWDEEEIILTGPPAFLKGMITLHNRSDEKVLVRDLAIQATERSAVDIAQQSLPLHSMLQPRETRLQKARISLNPTTPPGTYRFEVQSGKTTRPLTLIVQEHLRFSLSPQRFVLLGIAPEQVHQKEILLANMGNIPVTVPNIRHNTTLDMDLICRNLSMAIRDTGSEGIEATMDTLVKGIREDMVDWLDITIQEAGEIIEPGTSKLLHISFKLPKDIDPRRVYEGEIRFLDSFLSYRILPAAQVVEEAPVKRSAKKK